MHFPDISRISGHSTSCPVSIQTSPGVHKLSHHIRFLRKKGVKSKIAFLQFIKKYYSHELRKNYLNFLLMWMTMPPKHCCNERICNLSSGNLGKRLLELGGLNANQHCSSFFFLLCIHSGFKCTQIDKIIQKIATHAKKKKKRSLWLLLYSVIMVGMHNATAELWIHHTNLVFKIIQMFKSTNPNNGLFLPLQSPHGHFWYSKLCWYFAKSSWNLSTGCQVKCLALDCFYRESFFYKY